MLPMRITTPRTMPLDEGLLYDVTAIEDRQGMTNRGWQADGPTNRWTGRPTGRRTDRGSKAERRTGRRSRRARMGQDRCRRDQHQGTNQRQSEQTLAGHWALLLYLRCWVKAQDFSNKMPWPASLAQPFASFRWIRCTVRAAERWRAGPLLEASPVVAGACQPIWYAILRGQDRSEALRPATWPECLCRPRHRVLSLALLGRRSILREFDHANTPEPEGPPVRFQQPL
jgi:hypothetical protein